MHILFKKNKIKSKHFLISYTVALPHFLSFSYYSSYSYSFSSFSSSSLLFSDHGFPRRFIYLVEHNKMFYDIRLMSPSFLVKMFKLPMEAFHLSIRSCWIRPLFGLAWTYTKDALIGVKGLYV